MNNFNIMFYVSPGASEIRFREYNIENKTTQVFVVLISENNTISYKHGDRIKSTFIVLSSKEAFFHKLKEHGIIGPFTIHVANMYDSFKESFWIWYCN